MRVAIIGGGIGGLSAYHALRRFNINVTIFEQTDSFKPVGAGIGIGSNAMLALQKLGLAEDVIQNGMPLHKQRFLNKHFKVVNEIDFTLLKKKYGEETLAIERSQLHRALYEQVEMSDLHFKKRLQALHNRKDGVELIFQDGSHENFDYCIGADGLHSVVRQQLTDQTKLRYAGYTCWRGITKGISIEAHLSSEAWAPFGRFGFAPLKNGDIYWFACLNSIPNNPAYKEMTKQDLAQHFSQYNDLVKEIIVQTEDESFLHHDLYDIKPLDQYVYGRTMLLGDAAHATTPNMGQGAGQSIEDSEMLYEGLKRGLSIDETFHFYERKRLKKANKVIRLSRQIGWFAQWTSPFFTRVRDWIMPHIPSHLLFKRLHFLFKS